MQLKTVLFDLDDTLYHSWADCDKAAYAAIGAYAQTHLGIDGAQFVREFDMARYGLMRALPGAASGHDRTLMAVRALEKIGQNPMLHAEAIADAYWNAVLDTMQPWPENEHMLSLLRQAGITIGVCTNMTTAMQLRKIRRLGLSEKIDFIVTSEEAGADKPAPQLYLLALAKAAALKQEAIFVGDTYSHDIIGALDIGIEAIWFNWRKRPQPQDGRTGYQTAESMEQLITLLQKGI